MSEGCDPAIPTAGTTCPRGGVENCLDNDASTTCQTDYEPNPWFVLRYASPITVSEVVLSRVYDTGDYSVYVTDTMPVKGEVVTTGNRFIHRPGVLQHGVTSYCSNTDVTIVTIYSRVLATILLYVCCRTPPRYQDD